MKKSGKATAFFHPDYPNILLFNFKKTLFFKVYLGLVIRKFGCLNCCEYFFIIYISL